MPLLPEPVELYKNADYYLIEKSENPEVLLFKTADPNLNISITDGYIEIIERINESEYKRYVSNDYIYYQGSYKYVGTTTKYLTWTPGGP